MSFSLAQREMSQIFHIIIIIIIVIVIGDSTGVIELVLKINTKFLIGGSLLDLCCSALGHISLFIVVVGLTKRRIPKIKLLLLHIFMLGLQCSIAARLCFHNLHLFSFTFHISPPISL